MKKSLVVVALGLAALTSNVNAGEAEVTQALRQKLGITQIEILPSPIAGLDMAITESGVLYVSSDGRHILQGPMYDISGATPVDTTNQQLGPVLREKMAAMEPQMIVYKAPQEKYQVTVFTDITCGYCLKLHKEMQGYNELGITVRYLAYPRQGIASEAEKKMQSIWCAADRMSAFDDAAAGKAVKPATCDIDLKRQYELGGMYGIQGTPAIVVDGATVLPGYRAPSDLNAALEAYAAHQKAAVKP